jgi:adenylate kinase family enzyme
LPVIHLDPHFWKPGWVAPSELEWRERQSGLLAGGAWIADGNYHQTLDLSLERADTVVFLDTPWWVCAGLAFLRGMRRSRSGRRPKSASIPPGDEYATSCVWSSSSGETAA